MIMNDMKCHAYDCNANACVTPECYKSFVNAVDLRQVIASGFACTLGVSLSLACSQEPQAWSGHRLTHCLIRTIFQVLKKYYSFQNTMTFNSSWTFEYNKSCFFFETVVLLKLYPVWSLINSANSLFCHKL
jgi:hypothetical protein